MIVVETETAPKWWRVIVGWPGWRVHVHRQTTKLLMPSWQCVRAFPERQRGWLWERIVCQTAWCRDETMLLWWPGRPSATANGFGWVTNDFGFRCWSVWVEGGEVVATSTAWVSRGPCRQECEGSDGDGKGDGVEC